MKYLIFSLLVLVFLNHFENVESTNYIYVTSFSKQYYATPSYCTHEYSILITNTTKINFNADYLVGYKYKETNANGTKLSAIVELSIPKGSVKGKFYVNGDALLELNYDCYAPPEINFQNISPLVFSDRLNSLTITSTMSSVYAVAYYPYICDVADASQCISCKIEPIPPFVGKYQLSLDPIFSTSCNLTAIRPLNYRITDPYTNVSYNHNYPTHPYLYLKGSNYTTFEQILPENVVNAEYNGVVPTKVFTATASDSIDSISVFYLSTSTAQALVKPTIIGLFNTLSFNYYRIQLPVSTNLKLENYVLRQGVFSLERTYERYITVNYTKKQDLKINTFNERIVNGNLYLSSDFNLSQSDSFKINYNSDIRQFKFPFGFGKGTLQSYNHRFDYPLSVYQKEFISQPFYQNQSLPTFTYTNPIALDITPPVITNYQIDSLTLQYKYRFEAYDLESGIYSITFKEDYDPRGEATVVLYASDLVNGTIWNGIFETTVFSIGIAHDRFYTITILNRAGLTQTYRSGQYTLNNIYFNYFPKQFSLNLNNITNFKIEKVFADFYFIKMNLTNINSLITPRIIISNYQTNIQTYEKIILGKYNVSSNSYSWEYRPPKYISTFGANVKFTILGDRDIPSSQMYGFTQTYWQINAGGDNVIMRPPIITSIIFNQKNISTIELGVNVACVGQVNCVSTPIVYFTLTVQGQYNPIPYVFKSQSTVLSSVTFTFQIEPSFCRSQYYTIKSAILNDGVLESNSYNPNLLSPFQLSNPDNRTFYVPCATVAPDLEPPFLKLYNISKTTIYANETEEIQVFIVIADNIRIRYNTTILYLSTPCGSTIEVYPSSLYYGTDKELQFWFNFKIDRFWATGNISLSLYGLVDTYDNFNGYSTSDLSQFGPSIIHRIYPGEPPTPPPQLQPTSTPSPTPTATPKPCTNKCSGNGICILDDQCKCNNGFYGPNCEGTVLAIPKPLPNPEEPTIISEPNSEINLDIQFSELLELNSDKSIIERYPLQNKKWKMESSSDNNTFTYSTKINNETTLYIIIDLTTDERTIEFAGLNITIPPHSIKYTMKLDQYFFKSQLNILQLRMSTAFNSSESLCSSSIDTSSNTKDLEYIKIQYNGKILYGKFIQRSLVDGIPQVATTELIQSTESNGTSFIGINIPNYNNHIILDPNFSVLVTDNFDKCKSSKLSTGAIVGIAVGCAAFVIIVVVGATIFGSKTRRTKIAYGLRRIRGDKTRDVELK